MDKALAIQKEVQRILGTNEVYLPIADFEGYYEVSNTGLVRSVDRVVTHARGKVDKPHDTKYYGMILKQKIDRYGYPTVCIMKNGKRRYTTVHRLVAETFLCNVNKLPQINHIDANKLNNNINNLEWVSALDNVRHAIGLNLQHYASGEELPQTKIDRRIATVIKTRLLTGESQISIARDLGLNKNVIWRISKGHTWKKV